MISKTRAAGSRERVGCPKGCNFENSENDGSPYEFQRFQSFVGDPWPGGKFENSAIGGGIPVHFKVFNVGSRPEALNTLKLGVPLQFLKSPKFPGFCDPLMTGVQL